MRRTPWRMGFPAMPSRRTFESGVGAEDAVPDHRFAPRRELPAPVAPLEPVRDAPHVVAAGARRRKRRCGLRRPCILSAAKNPRRPGRGLLRTSSCDATYGKPIGSRDSFAVRAGPDG